MRIIILGAGTVGSWIAETLCKEHDVTVVDTDLESIREMDSSDVQVLEGSVCDPAVLFASHISNMELCIAVTGDDATNILAASMAKHMGVPTVIARVQNPILLDTTTFDCLETFEIDRLISLESLTAEHLATKIRTPTSEFIEHIAQGSIKAIEVEISGKNKMIGKSIAESGLPEGVHIGLIRRKNAETGQREDPRIAVAADVLCDGDKITLIGDDERVDALIDEIYKKRKNKHEAGPFNVCLIEKNEAKVLELANKLNRVEVVHGDATTNKTLQALRIETADFFVACIGDEENNIMACVEVDHIFNKTDNVVREDRRVMCVIHRKDYSDIVKKLGIDETVSPRTAMKDEVHKYVGDSAVRYSQRISSSDISVYEILIEEDAPAIEHVLTNLDLPVGRWRAATLTHNGTVRVPRPDDHFEAGDYIVALIHDDAVDEVIKMFTGTGR
jgi:trk system potassium uptake protein TrkA